MSTLSDEILMSMADGTLSAEEHLAVERQLAIDPHARRLVLLFRLSAVVVREAFSGAEFDRTPERLRNVLRRRRTSGCAVLRNTQVLAMRRPLQLAACLAAVVAAASVLHLAVDRAASTSQGSVIGLGPVDRGSELAKVLERHDGDTFVPASAASHRFIVTAAMRDKFGNACREVDAYQGDGANAQPDVILACRTTTGEWVVVGAVATASRPGAPYVPVEEDTRGVLGSVLSMIGARQRTSVVEKESHNP